MIQALFAIALAAPAFGAGGPVADRCSNRLTFDPDAHFESMHHRPAVASPAQIRAAWFTARSSMPGWVISPEDEPARAHDPQGWIDQAFNSQTPARRAFGAALGARGVFDRLLVATHVPGRAQARARAALAADPRLTGVPRLGLISEHYPADAEFAEFFAHLLYSAGGEFSVAPVAREVFLIGALERVCLSQTMHRLVISARHAGLPRLALRVLVDHTHPGSGRSFRELRDDPRRDGQWLVNDLEAAWVNLRVLPDSIAWSGPDRRRVTFEVTERAIDRPEPAPRPVITVSFE